MTTNPDDYSSIREHIHHLVRAITPYDEIEQEHLHNTCLWIKSGAPLFRVKYPDVPSQHFVCNFILFDASHRKVLMTDHKKSRQWRPPGGHMEPNEAPKETVTRECLEELNITADFWRPDPVFLNIKTSIDHGLQHTDVGLWYVLKGESNTTYSFDPGELNAICWFHLNDIPYEKSDPHMKRFIEKLKMLEEVRQS